MEAGIRRQEIAVQLSGSIFSVISVQGCCRSHQCHDLHSHCTAQSGATAQSKGRTRRPSLACTITSKGSGTSNSGPQSPSAWSCSPVARWCCSHQHIVGGAPRIPSPLPPPQLRYHG
mmetsp:Transcript_91867/g.230883  ORF Transcript_91867/g.230883 Transcript_91867/m.230883 type:complete len:117 (-) Transcript_91867:750-1100(-)